MHHQNVSLQNAPSKRTLLTSLKRSKAGPPQLKRSKKVRFDGAFCSDTFWWCVRGLPMFVVSVISAYPAHYALVCACLSCLRLFVLFVIPVMFVKATRLQTIGLANPSFIRNQKSRLKEKTIQNSFAQRSVLRNSLWGLSYILQCLGGSFCIISWKVFFNLYFFLCIFGSQF